MATPQAERKQDLAYQKRVEVALKEILAHLNTLEKQLKEVSGERPTSRSAKK